MNHQVKHRIKLTIFGVRQLWSFHSYDRTQDHPGTSQGRKVKCLLDSVPYPPMKRFSNIVLSIHIFLHACSVTSVMSDSLTLMDCSPPGPLSTGFSQQEYWSGLPCPSPGDLPDPGIESALQADSLPPSHWGEAHLFCISKWLFLSQQRKCEHYRNFWPFSLVSWLRWLNDKPDKMSTYPKLV